MYDQRAQYEGLADHQHIGHDVLHSNFLENYLKLKDFGPLYGHYGVKTPQTTILLFEIMWYLIDNNMTLCTELWNII